MDNFSNYISVNLLKNKRALTVIKCLLINWFSIFDLPETIITDSGGEFKNQLLQDFCDRLRIKLVFGEP